MEYKPNRYRFVDICRGCAALSVLIWHYQHFSYPKAGIQMPADLQSTQPFFDYIWPIYQQGGLAVQLFWVLSGFVFAASYLERPIDGWAFFIARFARLYPLHLATLLLVAALQFISWQMLGHFQIYPHNDAYHFVLNLFMAQCWGLESGVSFNAPTWSISVEVVIYAVFFLCLRALKLAPLPGAIICAFSAGLLIATGYHGPFVFCGLFFFLGVAAFAVLRQSALYAFGISLTALTGFCVSRWFLDGGLTTIEMSMLFVGIILFAGVADKALPITTTRFDWFGNATYGTYLLHIPIQITVLIILQLLGIPQAPILASPACFILFLLATFGLAVVVYRSFEKPSDTIIRRSGMRQRRETQSCTLER
jgi:peptidoglycan/LPS O-acetylase OafA/YrhL